MSPIKSKKVALIGFGSQIGGLKSALRNDRDAATDDPFRTFAEWDSPADAEAYAGL